MSPQRLSNKVADIKMLMLMEVLMHLNEKCFDIPSTRVGFFAFLGYMPEEDQEPEDGILKLWAFPTPDRGPADWVEIIEDTFKCVEWEGDLAFITIRITPPLRNAQNLLDSYIDQIFDSKRKVESDPQRSMRLQENIHLGGNAVLVDELTEVVSLEDFDPEELTETMRL